MKISEMFQFKKLKAKIIGMGRVNDGDLLIIRSDDVTVEHVKSITEVLFRLTGKKLIVIGIGDDDDIEMLKLSEAKPGDQLVITTDDAFDVDALRMELFACGIENLGFFLQSTKEKVELKRNSNIC